MILIHDDELPIEAAAKLVKGTKEPTYKALDDAIKAEDGADMFTDEELKEIAMYLLTYCEAHKQSSTN